MLCSACAALLRPPVDHNQLSLWPLLFLQERVVPLEHEPHYSHGRMATQAQKRKSPYH